MALFGSDPKNYNTIVAPLKRIEGELTTYIGTQKTATEDLEKEKKDIDVKIGVSNLEVRKSEHTVAQISALLATDFDEETPKPAEDLPTPDEFK